MSQITRGREMASHIRVRLEGVCDQAEDWGLLGVERALAGEGRREDERAG